MQTKPSIVFVHGLWADGSCFSKVIPPLQAEGYEVMATQYSLDTLEGDVATVNRTLGRVSSPAILVGHSYGGRVITAAGTDDRVAGLVYIAALAPDENETSQSQQDKFPVTDVFSYIEVADGRVWMRPDGIACFAGDLPEQEQKLVWATQCVPAADLFNQKVEGHRVEVEAKLVHRRQQRPHRPSRSGALRRRSAWAPPPPSVDSSHVPMLSNPKLRARCDPEGRACSSHSAAAQSV